MLPFVKNEGLTRVEAHHIGLADLKAGRVNYLRGVCDSTTHSRSFVIRLRALAMPTMVPIREGRTCTSLLSKLGLSLF